MKNFGLTVREKNKQQGEKRSYNNKSTKVQSQAKKPEVNKTRHH